MRLGEVPLELEDLEVSALAVFQLLLFGVERRFGEQAGLARGFHPFEASSHLADGVVDFDHDILLELFELQNDLFLDRLGRPVIAPRRTIAERDDKLNSDRMVWITLVLDVAERRTEVLVASRIPKTAGEIELREQLISIVFELDILFFEVELALEQVRAHGQAFLPTVL